MDLWSSTKSLQKSIVENIHLRAIPLDCENPMNVEQIPQNIIKTLAAPILTDSNC